MNDKIKISVIISVYNSEKFIKGRLDNLIEQTIFNNTEIIIVNSGSEQNEELIIEDYLTRYNNIKYIKTLERETIYKAWNRGIKISKGKYITNANTDDRLRNDAFEKLSKALDKNPDKAIVYADQFITDIPNPTFKDIDKGKKFNRPDYSRLRHYCGYIAGSQSMWRASLHFQDNIWFDEKFEVSGDNDFVSRVIEKYDLMRVRGVLGIYYKASDNSNKEFRNYVETHKESLDIREQYMRRYLESLSYKEMMNLERKIFFCKKAPLIYKIIRKIIEIVYPYKQIPRREFMFLIASYLEEIKGNYNKALEYCNEYIDITVDKLIKRQYNNLLKYK